MGHKISALTSAASRQRERAAWEALSAVDTDEDGESTTETVETAERASEALVEWSDEEELARIVELAAKPLLP